jgi:hypothetical protein
LWRAPPSLGGLARRKEAGAEPGGPAADPEVLSKEAEMTSATIKPVSGGRHMERQGYGLVLFASVMLLIIGCFNLIYGIAAVANAHVFVAGAHYVWGDLRFWGWATLIIGALQLLAAAGAAAGYQLARWFGVAVLGINAIAMMFFLPAYPLWALVIVAADVVALYGLCAYGGRANLAA